MTLAPWAAIIGAVMLSGSFAGKSTMRRRQPHIVLIVADDVGWNDVGFHGSEIATPTLDRLARSGVVLNNYYVQPTCAPTRGQLLTGKYQINTGFYSMSVVQKTAVPLDQYLLPEALRNSGYATHLIGKWHLGHYSKEYLPTRRGFESFFGLYTGMSDYFTKSKCEYGFCGYDLWENETVYNATDSSTYSTLLYTDRATKLIKNHNQDKPLFLMLSYQAVHAPLQVPEAYLSQHSHIKDSHRRVYAGMMSCLDEGVLNVTSALAEAGMSNDTVLVFTTDNGGQVMYGGNNWPLRGWKNSLFEGGIRAAAFVNSPLLKGGRISGDLMHVTDWYPTFLSLTKSCCPIDLDGFNVWRALRGLEPSPRQEVLHELKTARAAVSRLNKTGEIVSAALRYFDWKLIIGSPGNVCRVHPRSRWRDGCPQERNLLKTPLLFNIRLDPEERHNLAEQYPETVEYLHSKLLSWQRTAVPQRAYFFNKNANPQLTGGTWGPWPEHGNMFTQNKIAKLRKATSKKGKPCTNGRAIKNAPSSSCIVKVLPHIPAIKTKTRSKGQANISLVE